MQITGTLTDNGNGTFTFTSLDDAANLPKQTGAAASWIDDFTDEVSAKNEADARTQQLQGQPTYGYKHIGQGQYKVMAINAIGAGTLDYISPWTFPPAGDVDPNDPPIDPEILERRR